MPEELTQPIIHSLKVSLKNTKRPAQKMPVFTMGLAMAAQMTPAVGFFFSRAL